MKRGAWWPIGVTVVLATTVAANIWVMRIANDDPSFAIEQDYYKKAIAWDSTLAQGRESARLGWQLTPRMGPIARDGRSRLTAHLRDATGAPIVGAVVHVAALYVGRASDVHEATLAPSGAGEYATDLDARHAGQWELRFDVRTGSAHFTEVARVEVRRMMSFRAECPMGTEARNRSLPDRGADPLSGRWRFLASAAFGGSARNDSVIP